MQVDGAGGRQSTGPALPVSTGAIATSYDKTAQHTSSRIHLAAAVIGLNEDSSKDQSISRQEFV